MLAGQSGVQGHLSNPTSSRAVSAERDPVKEKTQRHRQHKQTQVPRKTWLFTDSHLEAQHPSGSSVYAFQATLKVTNPRRGSAARVTIGSAFRCARTACWELQYTGGGHSPWWLAVSGEDTVLPIRGRRRGRLGVARNNFCFPWPLEPYLKAAMDALNPRRGCEQG